jgi:UDP-2,4-diacetamido-2,4,6-trideoxy-beta-L-altropyranose hydrolase
LVLVRKNLIMKIAIRVDASIHIGIGHMMRCLALAEALQTKDVRVVFVCKEHPNHSCNLVEERGFEVFRLNVGPSDEPYQADASSFKYAAWLGTTQSDDTAQTIAALQGNASWDWIIVDHYALDYRWELAVRNVADKIMVIDDLADRRHDCDLLLDQTFLTRAETRYAHLVSPDCRLLMGPSWALVRPEFAALRQHSLLRRAKPALDKVIVCMGGSDPDNETMKAVEGLIQSHKRLAVDVIVGGAYSETAALRKILDSMPASRLHIQTDHMAQLMTEADFAITSGGTITWEKCVLGLPGMTVILDDNQELIAQNMHNAEAQITLGRGQSLSARDYAECIDAVTPTMMARLSRQAATICDGHGTERVCEILLQGEHRDVAKH